jgi:oxygen-independent coproporphyrinogen-3 oxidase
LFQRVSFDLIYARRKEHKPAEWRKELRQALSLGTKHISLYNLSFENGTVFEKKRQEGKCAFLYAYRYHAMNQY